MTSSDEGSDIRRRDAAEEGSPMVVRLWEIETEDADPPPVLKPRRRRILQSPGNKDIANAFFFFGSVHSVHGLSQMSCSCHLLLQRP